MSKPTPFLTRVNEMANSTELDWDTAWRTCRAKYPAEYSAMVNAPNRHAANAKPVALVKRDAPKQFLEAVNERMDRTGEDFDAAWRACKIKFPHFLNEGELNPKVELSADGQKLIDGTTFPPPPEVLMAMGLPANVTPEQFRIWKAAFTVELTPEIACRIIVETTRRSQVAGGNDFQKILEYLKTHAPELFKLATQVANKK